MRHRQIFALILILVASSAVFLFAQIYLSECCMLAGNFTFISSLHRFRSFRINISTKHRTVSSSLSDGVNDTLKEEILDNIINNYKVKEVSCQKLFAGDRKEIKKARKLSQTPSLALPNYKPDGFYASRTCEDFQELMVTHPLSQEEIDFPIAFGLTIFKDFYQVFQLLRAVYRPQNFYCIHFDVRASNFFKLAVQRFAECFKQNVVLAPKSLTVNWGHIEVLETEILCMKALLQFSKSWKYFINLTGQEYPLRTMLELVRALKALNGANSVEAGANRDFVDSTNFPELKGMRWYKGSLHATLSRGFVDYAMNNAKAQKLLERIRQGRLPAIFQDESFFATLNHNPSVLRAPGAYLGKPVTDNVIYPFFTRYKNWHMGVFNYPCMSHKVVRQICIWGVGDLHDMNKRIEFFVNKFYYDFQPFALRCMEERLWLNTLADYYPSNFTKTFPFGLESYSKFSVVRNHL